MLARSQPRLMVSLGSECLGFRGVHVVQPARDTESFPGALHCLCLSGWLLLPSRPLLTFLLVLGRLNPTIEL